VDLPEAVAQAVAELRTQMRKTGKVTAVVGNKVDVDILGSVIRLPKYMHYSPTVGDVVLIDCTDPSAWIVNGKPG
jgi:hypothetical protein